MIDMYLYRELCACVVLSFLCYPRPVRVWVSRVYQAPGRCSPSVWASPDLPRRDPHRLMISYACVSRSEKRNCELNCVWLSVWSVFKHTSSRSLVKRDLDGPLCTDVLSQFIWREITVLERKQCTELPHTSFYSTTKQFSVALSMKPIFIILYKGIFKAL